MAPTRPFAAAIVFAALAVAVQASWEEEDGNSLYFKPSVVDAINADPSAGWEAGFNERVHTLSRAAFKGLLGTYRKTPAGTLKTKKRRGTLGASLLASLPKNFDSRDKWSQCPTINHIRDQGHCGSCWAFGAVETLSDRFCVRFNESIDLSTEDLLSCCGDQCGDGCDGGWPYKAWQFFVRKGVVTEACQPYFDQEGCKHPGCEPVMPTPACELKCKDNEVWGTSKHFAEEAYRVDEAPEEIMAEIYENGPVEVSFDVYEDFTYYKKGVYRHIAGGVVGGHAVKFIGWGTTEDGVDYWLVANSWNRSWGEDGYFRIVRGTNECGIEEDVVAGLPARRGSVPTPSSALNDAVAII